MKIINLLVATTIAASVAAAQTKLSGTGQCPQQPGERHAIEIGDYPGHLYVISKNVCTWTKPADIAGLKSKDHVGVNFTEIERNKARELSAAVGTMDNGDKYYVRLQGTATMADQKFQSSEGTWNYTGGTGKLKGIKGKGTYKCTPEGENVNCDIEGEYTLPSK